MHLDVGLGRRRQDLGKDFWVKIRLWRPLPRGHSGGCALRRQGLGWRVATAVPGLPTPRGWRPAGRTGPSPGAGGVGEGGSARTVRAPLPAGQRAPGPAGSHLSGPRGAPGCGPRRRLAPLSWLPGGRGAVSAAELRTCTGHRKRGRAPAVQERPPAAASQSHHDGATAFAANTASAGRRRASARGQDRPAPGARSPGSRAQVWRGLRWADPLPALPNP